MAGREFSDIGYVIIPEFGISEGKSPHMHHPLSLPDEVELRHEVTERVDVSVEVCIHRQAVR